MSGMKDGIIMLCAALLLAAIIKLLAPTGATQKALKTVISAFILISLVLCIRTVFSSATAAFDWNTGALNETELSAQVLDKTSEYLVEYIDNLLKQEGIEAKNIYVNISKGEDEVINTQSIVIYISKEDENKKAQIKSIISEIFYIEPDVVCGE